MTPAHMIPLHLGDLHPFQQALTLALAFGPFVVLGIVIAVRRRLDAAASHDVERGGPGRVRDPRSTGDPST
ncbi:MAG: hypothetical protein WKF79_14400 [Nocardioides sp.]